jgi:hypothetical protein
MSVTRWISRHRRRIGYVVLAGGIASAMLAYLGYIPPRIGLPLAILAFVFEFFVQFNDAEKDRQAKRAHETHHKDMKRIEAKLDRVLRGKDQS